MPALLAVMTLFSSCSKDYESPLSGRTIPDMTFESGRGEQSVELGDVSQEEHQKIIALLDGRFSTRSESGLD